MTNVSTLININDIEMDHAYNIAVPRLYCTVEEAQHIDDKYIGVDLHTIFLKEIVEKLNNSYNDPHILFTQHINQCCNKVDALANTFIISSKKWLAYVAANYISHYAAHDFEDPFWQKARQRSIDHAAEECYFSEKGIDYSTYSM